MPILSPTETLERHIDQNGVLPGPQKLAQFQQALRLRGTPPFYSQDGQGDEAIVYVKIFDPSGSWTWYLTEWDGAQEAAVPRRTPEAALRPRQSLFAGSLAAWWV